MIKYIDLYPVCIARHTFDGDNGAVGYYILFESGRLRDLRQKMYDLATSKNQDFASKMELGRSFSLPLGYSGYPNPFGQESATTVELHPENCVMGLKIT